MQTDIAVIEKDELLRLLERHASAAAEHAVDRIQEEIEHLYDRVRAVNGVHTKYTLAELLDVSPETVMTYVRDGRLRVYRPGRNPIFLIDDVIEFIKAHEEK